MLLFGFGLLLGFVSAIPPGAAQVEMGKRAIQGRLFTAGLVIVGSVSADIFYGVISLYGIAPFIETPWGRIVFYSVSAVVLGVLAVLTFLESRKAGKRRALSKAASAKDNRKAFVTGMLLSFGNPTLLLSWLLGLTLARELGLAKGLLPIHATALFIAGGAIGQGAYFVLLSWILSRLQNFFSSRAIQKIYFGLGILLVFLTSVLVFQDVGSPS